MYKRHLVIASALVLLTSGCATMNKNECLTADWRTIGYEDGSSGNSTSRFSKHRKACSKHAVTADFDAYRTGHQQGARSYCTPETGYNLGKHNKSMPRICPSDLVESVRQGYNLGKVVFQEKYQLQQEIKFLQEDLATIDESLVLLLSERADHEEYLALAEAGVNDPKLSKLEKLVFYTQREAMRKLIRQKDEEISELEREKLPITRSIDDLAAEIQQLNAQPLPRLR